MSYEAVICTLCGQALSAATERAHCPENQRPYGHKWPVLEDDE